MGHGCNRCDFMGFDGSALTYLDNQRKSDKEARPKDDPYSQGLERLNVGCNPLFKTETYAMKQAILALNLALKKEGQNMQFNVKKNETSLSGNDFILLKDKESISGVFQGNPFEFKVHWLNNRSEKCNGKNCTQCSAGNKPRFRFRLNMIVKEGDQFKAKIFENSFRVYEQLRALNESDYDLEDVFVKITRSGEGTDTQYSILPLKNGALTDNHKKLISTVKLHNLDQFNSSQAANNQEKIPEEVSDSNEDFNDIPF